MKTALVISSLLLLTIQGNPTQLITIGKIVHLINQQLTQRCVRVCNLPFVK